MSEKRVYIVTAKGNAELTGAASSLTPDGHRGRDRARRAARQRRRCDDAREARESGLHFRAHRRHVVLLDVELPDSDGFDLLKRMRTHEFVKDVPIIMATAEASREAVLTGLRGGADGYVTKPYDMEVVLHPLK